MSEKILSSSASKAIGSKSLQAKKKTQKTAPIIFHPIRVSHPSRRDKLPNFKARADKSGGVATG